MDSIWHGAFWKATAERTIGTAAEAAIGVLTVDLIAEGIPAEAWWAVAIAAGVTVLKAIVTNTLTNDGPGIGGAETVTTTPPPVITEPGVSNR